MLMKSVRKYLLPLNLQTFNDDEVEYEIEEEEGIDIPVVDEDEQEEIELDDQEGHEEVDEQSEETLEVEKKGANETGKAVIAERRKWQDKLKNMEKRVAIADRMMKQAGVSDEEDFTRRLDALESQRLQEHGVPEELADRMAKTEREVKDQQTALRRQRFDVDAEKLKSDPFFSDIDEHMDDLVEFAEGANISIEDAYMVKHGKRRIKQRETEIEAKVKSNREKKEAKRVDVSPSGTSSTKKRVVLSQEERAIAKAAGMSAEEYAKYK